MNKNENSTDVRGLIEKIASTKGKRRIAEVSNVFLKTPHPQFLYWRETARFSFRVLVAMHYIVTLPYGCKSNAQY